MKFYPVADTPKPEDVEKFGLKGQVRPDGPLPQFGTYFSVRQDDNRYHVRAVPLGPIRALKAGDWYLCVEDQQAHRAVRDCSEPRRLAKLVLVEEFVVESLVEQ